MEKEIICGCFSVSKQDIEVSISNGVRSFKELQDLTNIGTECEPCFEKSKLVFKEIFKKTLDL